MKKREVFRGLFLILIALFSFQLVLASSVDSEIQKINHYAQEYETGNIDYIQLLVHSSAVRQNLNQILGATDFQQGGLLKSEQISSILGKASEYTKWVWLENENREKRMDSEIPIWKKIVFDGNKIQIQLSAFPSIFKKNNTESLIYRLNFDITFKQPKEQLDISGRITKIQELAKTFNSEPSQANAEELAKQSVNVERTFENYFRQSGEKCIDLMKSLFGTENQRESQQVIVQEINFYEGDRFDAIARLEICDDCEWNWINLNLWVNGRGQGMDMKLDSSDSISPEQLKNKDSAYFQTEIATLLDSYKKALEEKNFKEVSRINQRIQRINEAWNQRANDVWQQIDKEFQLKTSVISGEEMQKFNENFGWIKQEQEKKQKEKALRKTNYEERKNFYITLFSGYDKKEYYFEQKEFEKRLVEEFKESGKEICNNNIDDNKNEQVDCEEDMCSGKICGKGEVDVVIENQTIKQTQDLYCIEKVCKQREEIALQEQIICGNHKCEQGETIENCITDCSSCPVYPALECAGKVIFKGLDENNCSLEPICIEDKETCNVNEDCSQPLCGISECIKSSENETGKCQVKKGLEECKEAECSEGTTKVQECQISGVSSKVVIEICEQGVWKKTGIGCLVKEGEEDNETIKEQEIEEIIIGRGVGNACSVKEDCGGENDVCSNGNCVSIPQNIQIKEVIEQEDEDKESSDNQEEEQESEQEETEQSNELQQSSEEISENAEQEEQQDEQSEEFSDNQEEQQQEQQEDSSSPTGGVIFKFFQTLLSKITLTGNLVTAVEEGGETQQNENSQSTTEDNDEDSNTENNQIETQDNMNNQENQQQNEDNEDDEDENREDKEEYKDREDNKDRMRKEQEQRENENKQRCEQECKRPCIEKCIKDNCGKELECNVDEEQTKCQGTCEPEKTCIEKCTSGKGDWWENNNQEEQKQEKGVFQVGGTCRTSQGKTEGSIWFGGWGEPFEQLQSYKTRYYSGGESDWCKQDLENLKIQRKEFEKGFNQAFAKWFFEEYLMNSAENWEQAVSGIFELYWKNADNQRQIAERMKCLNKNSIDELTEANLINIKYESEYGSIEYWEELKEVSIPGIEGRYKIISPYMKVWLFPNKEFIKYEMKKSMEAHEFPGSPEEKTKRANEEGPTTEEIEMIKQDKGFMKKLRQITDKYNGNLDAVVQFKDFETNEVVFNLYAQVNEQDILKMKPMLVSEVPEQDITIEIDFSTIYEMIYSMQKDMSGAQIESPPWDRKINPVQKIKQVTNGIKMYFKLKSIINSAKITPEEDRNNIEELLSTFFKMMSKGEEQGMQKDDKQSPENKDLEQEVLDQRDVTGKVIFN